VETIVNIPRFIKNNPRKNLPNYTSRKLGESNFLLSFARHFLSENNKSRPANVLAFREIPANGYGIVDFLVMSFKKQKQTNKIYYRPHTIYSFEIKLKDWRKALSQAYRYKYFSHYSIVVLPDKRINSSTIPIDTFKSLNIGLWGYDKENKTIIKYFTPKKSKPLHSIASEKITNQIMKKFKSQPIF